MMFDVVSSWKYTICLNQDYFSLIVNSKLDDI